MGKQTQGHRGSGLELKAGVLNSLSFQGPWGWGPKAWREPAPGRPPWAPAGAVDGVAGERARAGGPPAVPHVPGGLQGAPDAAVRPLLLQGLPGGPVPPPGLGAALPRVPAGGGLQQLPAQRLPGQGDRSPAAPRGPRAPGVRAPPEPPQPLLREGPGAHLWPLRPAGRPPAPPGHARLHRLQPHEGGQGGRWGWQAGAGRGRPGGHGV